MSNQILLEEKFPEIKAVKKDIIKEAKKFKGFCDINAKGLLNVIYYLNELNTKLISINNQKSKRITLNKIEGFYFEVINLLHNIIENINNCKFRDFDDENYLKTCKFIDDCIKTNIKNLPIFNKKHLNQINSEINNYRLLFNAKLEESTSFEKIICKYAFN